MIIEGMYEDSFDLNAAPDINWDALASSSSEEEFVHAGFDFLKEAMQLLTVIAGIRIKGSGPLQRNQAIIVGHYSRMIKLMRSLVRQIADGHGGDQQLSILREFMDSVSTVAYLLGDKGDGSRYDAFVYDSLIIEREFLKDVREQIRSRGGETWPIEIRITQSIEATFQAAGVSEADIPSRKRNNWPSNEDRITLLGPTAYSSYRTGSGAIHGMFADLEKHHLETLDGGFEIALDPVAFRPQPLITMALLSISTVSQYLSTYYEEAQNPIDGRL